MALHTVFAYVCVWLSLRHWTSIGMDTTVCRGEAADVVDTSMLGC